MRRGKKLRKGPLAWFAANGVAANLLMLLLLVGGFAMIGSLKQEVFPEISSDVISITVPYLGAAPVEVEQAVCVRIEEALADLEGIERLSSVAVEGIATVTAELVPGTPIQEVLSDVKTRVDAIDTFPVETEKPIVQEAVIRRQVVSVALAGDTDERTLKRIAEQVRDDLSALPGISQVSLAAARPYEISIEVSEDTLRRYGLTFDDVAAAVRRSSLDLPGGSIKTEGGEILLRTAGQARRGPQFEKLVLRTRPDGSRILLGDVARVVDGFAETDLSARFDGKPAVLVQVFRVGDQSAIEISDQVKGYVAEARQRLPESIQITTWQDETEILRSRLSLLMRNGRAGLILVFLVLALFLKLRLAGWVSLGIPISFLGTVLVMPYLDVSINLLSLFAFIVVLGIVVDDAIVVGENIYRHYREGEEGLAAAVAGVREMAVPVVFAVLTTIAAFSPLLVADGNIGKIMRNIPLIVIPTLVFSLIESLLILPAHLSHLAHEDEESAPQRGLRAAWRRFQDRFSTGLERFADRRYSSALASALEWRYLTVAIAVALLLVTAGLVRGGRIKFTFLPDVEADDVVAFLVMPQGTPVETTAAAVAKIEQSARRLEAEVRQETGESIYRHILATSGEQPYRVRQTRASNLGPTASGGHLGEVNIELVPAEERSVASPELAARWRELTGGIPDAVELTFSSSLISAGEAINVELSSGDLGELRRAAAELKRRLADYPGVIEITDSFRAGKEEIQLEITPEAEALGLRLSDVGRQVRQAFYGEEAQRIQRGRDDVRVMVRYPEEERRSLGNLESLRIRAPSGVEVPFSTAARAEQTRGFSAIRRSDRRRVINVTADVDPTVATANEVVADVRARLLPELVASHPGLSYRFAGAQDEQRKTISSLMRGFLFALLVIYGLLAVPFRSYAQPLIVMSAIPFGFIGAVAGHLLMGINLTILSGFGIVALTGVVVNDSLVMVDFINRARRAGMPLDQAIRQAGVKRFRPILLTSLTTFAGLTPLLLEKSLQAKFLIPMAVSLAFGVLFATVLTLFLVPTLYLILERTRRGLLRLWRGEESEREDPAEGRAPGDPEESAELPAEPRRPDLRPA